MAGPIGWCGRLASVAGVAGWLVRLSSETGILLKSFWNFGQNSAITRSVRWDSLAGWSGLLGTWALLLLGQFPKNRSQPLHQPLRISKGWREEVWVRGGKEWGVIKEEIGVLGESETPSGDLLGYRDS